MERPAGPATEPSQSVGAFTSPSISLPRGLHGTGQVPRRFTSTPGDARRPESTDTLHLENELTLFHPESLESPEGGIESGIIDSKWSEKGVWSQPGAVDVTGAPRLPPSSAPRLVTPGSLTLLLSH